MAGAAAGAALPGYAATLGATDGQKSFAQIAFSLAGVATIPVILLEACTAEFEREFGGDALVRFVRACERLDAQSLAAPLGDATLEMQARWIVKFLYTGRGRAQRTDGGGLVSVVRGVAGNPFREAARRVRRRVRLVDRQMTRSPPTCARMS